MRKLSTYTPRRIAVIAIMVAMLLPMATPTQAGQQSASTISFTVGPSPLTVNINAPSSVKQGSGFLLQATITNNASRSLTNGTVTLSIVPSGGISLAKTNNSWSTTIKTIDPGQANAKTVSWKLNALTAGNYTATVVASATDKQTNSMPQMGAQKTITVTSKSTVNTITTFLLQQLNSLTSLF